MNVRDLFRLTLCHLGEDMDEYTLEEFRFAMLSAMNRAYMEIMRNKRRPMRNEQVPARDGVIDVARLSNTCALVCSVRDGLREVPFELLDEGRISVKADGELSIRYLALPPMLAAEEDVPRFPAAYHAALADYAAYTILGSTARQARAEFFLRNYMNAYSNIPPEVSSTMIAEKWA